MFRPLLVLPSSGWIQWSEELHNNAILSLKSGGDEISFAKNGACVQTGGIEIYTLLSLVCGNIFIHYWLAPEGTRGSCIVGR